MVEAQEENKFDCKLGADEFEVKFNIRKKPTPRRGLFKIPRELLDDSRDSWAQ